MSMMRKNKLTTSLARTVSCITIVPNLVLPYNFDMHWSVL